MKKGTKIWLGVSLFALAASVVCALVFLRGTVHGYSLVAAVLVAVLALKAFGGSFISGSARDNRDLRNEVDSLKKTIRDLDRELAEKSRSRLNVVELNPILHIAVLDVDTSFVRPYVREEKNLSFNGALRADLKVEYGIRLEDVLFQYDSMHNKLNVANFHPGIISYSRKQLKWEFAKSYRSRRFFGRGLSDISDRDAEAFTKQMCEKLRSELEEEIDNRKVAEFEWLSPLITDQVVDVLKMMVGRDSLEINISNGPAEGYVSLQQFRQQLDAPELIVE